MINLSIFALNFLINCNIISIRGILSVSFAGLDPGV
jgi:hypothetical protein